MTFIMNTTPWSWALQTGETFNSLQEELNHVNAAQQAAAQSPEFYGEDLQYDLTEAANQIQEAIAQQCECFNCGHIAPASHAGGGCVACNHPTGFA